MKFSEAINQADAIKPNAFNAATKKRWLLELEGKIAADVMLMDISELRQLTKMDSSDDRETLVSFPHDGLYVTYLMAKIDEQNGEFNKYTNTMQMFNGELNNFKRWFAQTYAPANGYYFPNLTRGASKYGNV